MSSDPGPWSGSSLSVTKCTFRVSLRGRQGLTRSEFLPPYTQQCKACDLPLLYRWGGGYQSGGSGHGGIRILPET